MSPRACSLALALLCVAGCGGSSGIRIKDPWARSSPAMASMGAAYLTITSASDDRLIGVEVPASVAARAEIHEVVTDSTGAMRMQPVSGVDLPAGEPVTFRPGAWHVMLIGLARPLVPGASFEMTLRLEHAAPHTVRVPVRGR